MFLPPELLTLFFLANAAAAIPQVSLLPNVTETAPIEWATVSIPTETTGTFDAAATESVSIDRGDGLAEGDPCNSAGTEQCCVIDDTTCGETSRQLRPGVPTATGWGETGPATDRLVTLIATETTVTTIRPTIINIETNLVEDGFTLGDATQASGDNNGQQSSVTVANTVRPSNKPGPSGDNIAGGDAPSVSGTTSQQTGQNSLLLSIVSQLGGTPSNVQPASPTTNSLGQTITPPSSDNGGGSAAAQPATTPNSGMPRDTDEASFPQVTPTVGTGYLVIGGAWTVTLTPGLSIYLGGNLAPTILEMTTDATGNTLVTVSSSGTAVTATVRVALTTMTMPKSGFEASITDSARPGEQSARLATTSSKGAGADKTSKLEWWTGAVLGILGFGILL
ncbi:hypothetical protein AA0119_g9135 [Alternaria tenuissima]|uniref:Uncharacterized protein n=1 Tax=Alternaria tenuissima TaxID=119927 RepID=A0AB37WKD2_9PLEO|nr:hypothetical protein AA0115_g4342 [Alternaria tenuissima]RYN94421.1 hypothetical protein AA0119_g9135 [Alternaria tenuissima]RYO19411.1 hypothetical protein AA0121_g4485 [Alternaria tenuissima]